MSFVNVGTFDAGIIGGSQAPQGMAGTPVFDAAAVASGNAFLVSELEKRDPEIRKPLNNFTYPRDIVIDVGGGWADYASAMTVGYGMTGGAGDGAVQAGGANGIPVVQASLSKGVYKAHAFAAALRVMYWDMMRSNFAGRSLESLLTDGVRKAYDKHMDQNTYVGFEKYDTTGLINNPDAVETTVAQGAASDTTWVKRPRRRSSRTSTPPLVQCGRHRAMTRAPCPIISCCPMPSTPTCSTPRCPPKS